MLTTSAELETSSKAAIVYKKIKTVGIGSIIFSIVTFLFSVVCRIHLGTRGLRYNNEPLSAAHLIISLVTACISVYQLAISSLLLMLGNRIKSDHYYLSLWYISHLSILPLYWSMFALELCTCLNQRQYVLAALAGVFIAVYQGTFTYFTIVVDKVMNEKYG